MLDRKWNYRESLSILLLITATCAGEITEFNESFSGAGRFDSTNGSYIGFDHPDWDVRGDWQFRNEGLATEIDTKEFEFNGAVIERPYTGSGSFVEKIQLQDVDL